MTKFQTIFCHFSPSKLQFRYLFQASGYSAYIGPFTSEFRKKAVNCWMQKMESLRVSHNPVFSLAEILGDQVAIRNWRISGLPGKFHTLSFIKSQFYAWNVVIIVIINFVIINSLVIYQI